MPYHTPFVIRPINTEKEEQEARLIRWRRERDAKKAAAGELSTAITVKKLLVVCFLVHFILTYALLYSLLYILTRTHTFLYVLRHSHVHLDFSYVLSDMSFHTCYHSW